MNNDNVKKIDFERFVLNYDVVLLFTTILWIITISEAEFEIFVNFQGDFTF